MTDAVADFNTNERAHIATIERRIDWLQHRIDNYEGHSADRDKAEHAALVWALEVIRDTEHVPHRVRANRKKSGSDPELLHKNS